MAVGGWVVGRGGGWQLTMSDVLLVAPTKVVGDGGGGGIVMVAVGRVWVF